MVFFFTTAEGYTIYMGSDKYENEDLIKYGIPEDIWFHVDDMSSAHVYLRLHKDQRLEDVSEETIEECSQLVKANSIEGCKLHEVYVVFTRWRNLHKSASMEVGAIGFHDRGKVKRRKVVKNNSIVNKITRTKEERHPDLAALQEQRAEQFKAEQKSVKRSQVEATRTAERERKAAARIRSYVDVMDPTLMTANTDHTASVDDSAARGFEDDFM